MTRKDRILQNFLVGLFGTTAFVTILIFSLTWVNGISYDRVSGTFEQKSVIAVESKISAVTVWLNGVKISDSLPFQKRNLDPGQYELEIRRNGYHSFQKTFSLRAGQVGLVEEVTLIAEKPLATTLKSDYRFFDLGSISTGLTLSNGELYDGNTLVTRFSRSPERIYRFNNAYLYLLDNEVRIFIPETSQDLLIIETTTNNPVINPKLFSWSFALKDGKNNRLINVAESSAVSADSLQ